MKDIVVFGAGHVAGPFVRYLLEKGYSMTVASRTLSKAERLVEGYENGEAERFNIESEKEHLDGLISEHEIAVSLLPYVYHHIIAEKCIEKGKNMVTTSYVSEEMDELDEEAKDSGVFILMECGLDPGLDHMSALKIIHDVGKKGGKITSFESYCGGLPAPEDNDNPFGYKFSWSPKGVLLAGKNAAKYLKDGETKEISAEDLFDHHWPMDIPELPGLEAYPNRNSLPYKRKYGLEDANTVFRGTLRYPGWSKMMKGMVDLGLLKEEQKDLSGMTYRELMIDLIDGDDERDVKKQVSEYLDMKTGSDAIERFEWLGLFDDVSIGIEEAQIIDVLVEKMEQELEYKPGEKDLIVLHHIFEAEYPDREEEITSTLIELREPNGESAMSRTVGLPPAIAVDMILQDRIQGKGVHIPTKQEIYEPILEYLDEEEDIGFKEQVKEK